MKGLLTSILTVLTFTGLQAQPLPTTPKLVVGLTIDQLRTDYLEAFSTLYGDKGFRRLWKEGRVFRNAEYTLASKDLKVLMTNLLGDADITSNLNQSSKNTLTIDGNVGDITVQ